MQQIEVVICTGTSCHVMGAEQLLGISEIVERDYPGKVKITGASCLGYCRNPQAGSAPFVTVAGRVIAEATVRKVIDEIDKLLNIDDS